MKSVSLRIVWPAATLIARASTARTSTTLILAALTFLALGAGSAQAVINAGHPDDVCPAVANPCIIEELVEIDDGAFLDFGNRDVVVRNGGSISVGARSGGVLCGDFQTNLSPGQQAIQVKGPDGTGTVAGGLFVLEARRGCSLEPKFPCIRDTGCSLGPCNSRVCSENPNRNCTGNSNCQLGRCVPTQIGSVLVTRCENDRNVGCNFDSDCNFGTCNQGLTCRWQRDRFCSVDADCELGTCSVGNADILVSGKIAGSADPPARTFLIAADDITLAGLTNLDGPAPGADGGSLSLEAVAGTVRLEDGVELLGSGAAAGGDLEVEAGLDIVVNDLINANGGAFDGGEVLFTAGRDIIITADIRLNSTAGDGWGGFLGMDAGRDVLVLGSGALARTRLGLDGHFGVYEAGGGEAGCIESTIGGDFRLDEFTVIKARGARPDGTGGDLVVNAGGRIRLEGEIDMRAEGLEGIGGHLALDAGKDIDIPSTATVDLRGGFPGGRVARLSSATGVAVDGDVSVSGNQNEFGGGIEAGATAGDVSVTGRLLVDEDSSSARNSDIDIRACNIRVTGSGDIDNRSISASNLLIGAKEVVIASGGSLHAGPGGRNEINYGDAGIPPALLGAISPTAVSRFDGSIPVCAVCGDRMMEGEETCDDGNTVSGDGCSEDCQNEGCIADTAGYPAVALCDDGDGCTEDSCDTAAGTCIHEPGCDDGIDCTEDSCVNGACSNVASDLVCEDGNDCTDDVCTATGCESTERIGPCDDGRACTTNDTCISGACVGEFTPGCDACGDGFLDSGETCDSGSTTHVPGEYCMPDCTGGPCGRPVSLHPSRPTTTDALFILRTAVGAATCDIRICDVNSSQSVNASDALIALRSAVGIPETIACP